MSDPFYRAFEDRHRGSREAIQQRQRAYLSFLAPLARLLPGPTLADLGCGRGEWLELVRAEGWSASGVDLDEGMLAACREIGLDVRREDAVSFLQGLPDASVAAVTAFHVVEHLPFDLLHALTAQALRVLRPGGLLILETPNPENLVVGSSAFYMDPTHARPLPPPLLAFLPEFHGFARVKTLRLQEGVSLAGDARISLIDVLAGVSPDYAIVAQKAGIAGDGDAAHAEALAALEEAFAREWGVTLNQLAQRYDEQWAARLREAELAAELARESAAAAQASNSRELALAVAVREEAVDEIFHARHNHLIEKTGMQGHIDGLQDHVGELQGRIGAMDAQVGGLRQEVGGLQGQVESLEGQLEAVHLSTSWRLTAPLRWVSAQRKAWREQGAVTRLRRAGGKAARAAIRRVERHPQLRNAVIRALRAAGLDGFARQMRSQAAAPTAPPVRDPVAAAQALPQVAPASPGESAAPAAGPFATPAPAIPMTADASLVHATLRHAVLTRAHPATPKET